MAGWPARRNGRCGRCGSRGRRRLLAGGGNKFSTPHTIANNVTLTGRTLSDFDLSDNPGGLNDLVVINGNLTLQGTNTLVIRKLNLTLPPGVYPLINYSGTLSGNLNNLAVSGLPGVPLALTNPPGQIALVVKSYRALPPLTGPAAAAATSGICSPPPASSTVRAGSIRSGDTVRFDNLGTSNLTANLSGDLNTTAVIVGQHRELHARRQRWHHRQREPDKIQHRHADDFRVEQFLHRQNHHCRRTRRCQQTRRGWLSQPARQSACRLDKFDSLQQRALRITSESYTDRGLTLNAGQNTLDIFNAADRVTIAGQIIGSGSLVKAGAGNLALNVANTFSGGVILNNGAISLGSVAGNQTGVGTGSVTFYNGTLSMINIRASGPPHGRLSSLPGMPGGDCDGRCTLSGALTGGGTFNVMTPYVRTDFNGNWSAFTGQLNIITDADGGDFRYNNSAGYPNAKSISRRSSVCKIASAAHQSPSANFLARKAAMPPQAAATAVSL